MSGPLLRRTSKRARDARATVPDATIGDVKKSTCIQALFTRSNAVGKTVEQLVRGARTSVDAALYRLNHPRLARALHGAAQRGVKVRVILDRKKFELTPATRELVAKFEIPYRLMSGRRGRYAKLHHKMAILDGLTALTGSYNWTLESEENNYENLVIVRDPQQVKEFVREFEALWSMAKERQAARRQSPRRRKR